MMSVRPLLLACLLCVPTLAMAMAMAMAEDGPTIVQKDKQFSSDTVVVPRGGAVLFANQDSVRHNLALRTPDGEDGTGIVQAPGEVSRMTFNHPGLFQVHCLIHPQMRLAVQVR